MKRTSAVGSTSLIAGRERATGWKKLQVYAAKRSAQGENGLLLAALRALQGGDMTVRVREQMERQSALNGGAWWGCEQKARELRGIKRNFIALENEGGRKKKKKKKINLAD